MATERLLLLLLLLPSSVLGHHRNATIAVTTDDRGDVNGAIEQLEATEMTSVVIYTSEAGFGILE
jgi:hypothetical protein